jgi:hypothetical protein
LNRARRLALVLVCGVTSVACLFPSLSALTGGTGDAGDAGDAGEGGNADAGDALPSGDAALPGEQLLADVGAIQTATGNAQQTHVVWAVGAKRWWLFFIDGDTTSLKTRSSPDFVTWTDGPTLTLPYTNAGEGRNFSVAYAQLGGQDVIHVSFTHDDGSTQRHTHTRAVASAATLTFDTPADVCSIADTSSGADSPADLVLDDGTVWDSTGAVKSQNTSAGHFNEDVFLSPAKDTGASWGGGFAQTTVEVVNQWCNARQFLDLGGGDVVAAWEGGDPEPNPNNVHGAIFSQGAWGSPISLFSDASQDPNDWDGAMLVAGTAREPHLVRARLGGGYDHILGTGPSTASAPQTMARSPGSGLVLLADPDHLAIVDTAQDGTLEMASWTAAGSGQWSAWAALTGAGVRRYLSGYCPDLGAHPEAGGCAVLWTRPTNGGFQIAGLLVRPGA